MNGSFDNADSKAPPIWLMVPFLRIPTERHFELTLRPRCVSTG